MINTKNQEPLLEKERQSTSSNVISCVSLVLIIIIGLFVIAITSISVYSLAKNNNSSSSNSGTLNIAPQYTIPSKWAVSYSPPRALQLNRGTCWAFGTIGAFEHSYRLNGIKKGFLNETAYVPFSVQAFGIEIVNNCVDKPDVCEVLGDEVYFGNTDGGEVSWPYYIPDLWTQIFPDSLCPYLSESDEWNDCPDLDGALKNDTNPIRFTITGLQTAYDVLDSKLLLFNKKETIAISTPVHGNEFYIPCYEGDYTSSQLCSRSDLVKTNCPPWIVTINDNAQCILVPQPGYNMDGEWFLPAHVPYVTEGGHAMQIVGWNDKYRSYEGDVGGFIIKNSWVDQSYPFNLSQGLARGGRGSHSIQFLLQLISDWDEKQTCPNVDNPLNWLSCTSVQGGPTGDINRNKRINTIPFNSKNRIQRTVKKYRKSHANQDNPVSACLDPTEQEHLLNLTKQPVEFSCRVDTNASSLFGCSQNYRYFLDYLEFDENQYINANFIQVDPDDFTDFSDFTVYHLPISMLAEVFLPIDSQRTLLANNPDVCGYYFWPYSLLEIAARRSSSWFSTHFDIEWADSSYLANEKKYPQYDYQYFKKENGTKIQEVYSFGGPQPYTSDAHYPPSEL